MKRTKAPMPHTVQYNMSPATLRTQHLYVNKFPYNFQNEKVALDESAIDVLNMFLPTVVVIVVCLAAWLSRQLADDDTLT